MRQSVNIKQLENGYIVSHDPPPKKGAKGMETYTPSVEMAAAGLDDALAHARRVMGGGDMKTMKPGEGGRFQKMVGALRDKPGVKDPKALAAAIGRKKYGAKGMEEMAEMGKRRKALSNLRARRGA